MFTSNDINARLDAAIVSYGRSSTRVFAASTLFIMGGGKASDMRDKLSAGGVSWFSKAVTVASKFSEPFKALNDDWSVLSIAAAEKVIEAEIERKVSLAGSLNAMYYRAQDKVTPREAEATQKLDRVTNALRDSIAILDAIAKVSPIDVATRMGETALTARAAAAAAESVGAPIDKREQDNLAALADALTVATNAADIAAAIVEQAKNPVDPDEKAEADDAAASVETVEADPLDAICLAIVGLKSTESRNRVRAALAEADANAAEADAAAAEATRIAAAA